MFSNRSLALALSLLASGAKVANAQEDACASVPSLLTCRPTATPPTLDGDLSEFASADSISTPIFSATIGSSAPYSNGNMMITCAYDSTHIYFSIEVPGAYRFDSSSNEKCAAVATMFQVGDDATFYQMGGCPMAATSSQCSSGGLEECASHRVDIGSHWELAATDQGVEFPIGSVDNGGVEDEYAVSPYCRKHDDNEEGGGSEWAGAWVYSDASSSYKFELSRLLTTDSPSTDAQFVAGEVYSFGVAFWDPNESETDGWSDHGHYVTGCAQDWTDLWLAKEGETEPPMMDGSNAGDNMMDGGSTASKQGVVLGMVVTIASFFATLF